MSSTEGGARMIGRGESLVFVVTGRQADLAPGGEAAKRIDPRHGPFAAPRSGFTASSVSASGGS